MPSNNSRPCDRVPRSGHAPSGGRGQAPPLVAMPPPSPGRPRCREDPAEVVEDRRDVSLNCVHPKLSDGGSSARPRFRLGIAERPYQSAPLLAHSVRWDMCAPVGPQQPRGGGQSRLAGGRGGHAKAGKETAAAQQAEAAQHGTDAETRPPRPSKPRTRPTTPKPPGQASATTRSGPPTTPPSVGDERLPPGWVARCHGTSQHVGRSTRPFAKAVHKTSRLHR
jgi:hypothetical protein